MGALGLALALSYLAGSVPTALIVGRAVGGIDIRAAGSGNAGATNVYRLFGLKPYLFTLSVDMFKGYAACAFIAPLGAEAAAPGRAALLCGVAAIIGHIWTVFAGFKGGKGVATAGGVLLALAPEAAFTAIAVYLAVTLVTKYVSLGSMCAAVSAPVALLVSGRMQPPELVVIITALALLIIYTHRANIRRLLSGQETKTDFLGKMRGRG